MYYAVGQPCHDAEKGACMGGEDVAKIGTVEDVLKGREDPDPYGRPPTTRNESASIEEYEPHPYEE